MSAARIPHHKTIDPLVEVGDGYDPTLHCTVEVPEVNPLEWWGSGPGWPQIAGLYGWSDRLRALHIKNEDEVL